MVERSLLRLGVAPSHCRQLTCSPMNITEKITRSTFLTVPRTFWVTDPVSLMTANARRFRRNPSDAANKGLFCISTARITPCAIFLTMPQLCLCMLCIAHLAESVSAFGVPAAKYQWGCSTTRCQAPSSRNRSHSKSQTPTLRNNTHAELIWRSASN